MVTDEFRDQLRRMSAQSQLRAALYPLEVAQLSAQFGGSGEEITRARVAAEFGEDAAAAWAEVRAAGARFMEITKRKGGS